MAGELELPAIVQRFKADVSGLLDGQKAFGVFGDKVGSSLAGVSTNLTKFVSVPLLGVVAAAVKAGQTVQDAYLKIERATGQTGKAADGLKKTFDNVFASVPDSANEVADTISTLHQRIQGLNDVQLGDVSKKFLALKELTGQALDPDQVAKFVNAFQIAPDKIGKQLNTMAAIYQKTGTSVQAQLQYATVLRPNAQAVGFNTNQLLEVIGKTQQAGLNPASLNMVMARINQTAIKNGQSSKDLFGSVVGAIQNGGVAADGSMLDKVAGKKQKGSSDALADVAKLLGARGFSQFQSVVKSGSLNVSDNLGLNAEDVEQMVDKTRTISQQLQILKNQATVALKPLGLDIITAANGILQKLIPAFEKLTGWFNNLSPTVKNLLGDLGKIGVIAGPAMFGAAKIISGVQSTVTSLIQKGSGSSAFINGVGGAGGHGAGGAGGSGGVGGIPGAIEKALGGGGGGGGGGFSAGLADASALATLGQSGQGAGARRIEERRLADEESLLGGKGSGVRTGPRFMATDMGMGQFGPAAPGGNHQLGLFSPGSMPTHTQGRFDFSPPGAPTYNSRPTTVNGRTLGYGERISGSFGQARRDIAGSPAAVSAMFGALGGGIASKTSELGDAYDNLIQGPTPVPGPKGPGRLSRAMSATSGRFSGALDSLGNRAVDFQGRPIIGPGAERTTMRQRLMQVGSHPVLPPSFSVPPTFVRDTEKVAASTGPNFVRGGKEGGRGSKILGAIPFIGGGGGEAKGLDDGAKSLAKVAGQAEKTAGGLSKLGKGKALLGGVVEGLTGLPAPAALGIAAVAGVAFGLSKLYNSNTKAGHEFKKVWDTVWKEGSKLLKEAWDNYIHPALDALGHFLTVDLPPALQAVGHFFKETWDIVSSAVRTAWNIAEPILRVMIAIFKDELRLAFLLVQGVIKVGWAIISDSISTAWNVFGPIISTIIETVKGPLTTVWHDLSSVIGTVWDGISSKISGVIGNVTGFIKSFVGEIGKVLGAVGMDNAAKAISDWVGGGKPTDTTNNKSVMGPVAVRAGADGMVMNTGQMAGGAKTNQPTYLIGEGGYHPEYVIPTDPAHRKNAMSLYGQLSQDLGVGRAMLSGGKIMHELGAAPGRALQATHNLEVSGVHAVAGRAKDALGALWPKLGEDPGHVLTNIMPAAVNYLRDQLLGGAGSRDNAQQAQQASSGGSPAGAAPAGQVVNWIRAAEQIAGWPDSYTNGLYQLIMHESGGNPGAVNNWDSNAKAGTPSKGLMQTITSTFNSNAFPGHKNILDPIDNILAGTSYALKKYGAGMVQAGGRHDAHGGYLGYAVGGMIRNGINAMADGGIVTQDTIHRLGERGHEAVVPLTGKGAAKALGMDRETLTAAMKEALDGANIGNNISITGADERQATHIAKEVAWHTKYSGGK